MSAVPSSRRSSKLSDRFKPGLVCQTCLILTSLPTASAGEQTLLANQAVSPTTVKNEVAQAQAQLSNQAQTPTSVQPSPQPKALPTVAKSAQEEDGAPENTLESNAQSHELTQMKAKAQELRQAIEMSSVQSSTPLEKIADVTDSTQDEPLAPKNTTPQKATSNGEVTKTNAQTAQASQTKTSEPIAPYAPPATIVPVKKTAGTKTATPKKGIQNNDVTEPQAKKSSPIESYRPPQKIVPITASAKTKNTEPQTATPQTATPQKTAQSNEVAKPQVQASQAQAPQAKKSSPIEPYTPPKTIVPVKKATGTKNTTAQKSTPKQDTQNDENKSARPQAKAPELPQFPPTIVDKSLDCVASTADVIEAIKAKAVAQIKAAQTNNNKVTKPEAKALASPQFPPINSIKSTRPLTTETDVPVLVQNIIVEANNATSQNTAQSNEVAQPQAPASALTQFPPISSIQSPTPTVVNLPESAQDTTVEPNSATPNSAAPNDEVVGVADAPIIITGISITINNRTYERASATSVRGFGYGETREEFEQWLMPLGTVLEALEVKSRQISEQELELTSKFAVARLDSSSLTNDPELGLTISVKQVKDLLKIPVRFDLQAGTIIFDLPSVTAAKTARKQKELFLDGLPTVDAPGFSIGMVEQRVSTSGNTTTRNFRPQSTLLSVGSLLGGSWYAELKQNKLFSPGDWQLNALQFLKQTPQRDFFIGAQPTFWQGLGRGDFWGVTTIGRQGFAPDIRLDRRGGADPAARIQPAFVNASLQGYAEPGTLVRLMRGGEGGVLVAEQLVDASGRYEFRNIAVGRDVDSGTNYQLLLYPQGQLSAIPRIEQARFIILPEQLPAGAAAQIISAGWRRSPIENNFFGQFTEFSSGLSQRWGVSESLTLGLGSVYDSSRLQGIGELFFQPKSTPFRFSATGFLSNKSEVQFAAAWEDYPKLSAQWSYIRSKHFYNVDFPLPWLKSWRFNFNGDTDQGSNWGLQFSQGYRGGSLYGRLALQPSGKFSWDLFQNFYRFSLSHRKTDTGTTNFASYRVNRNSSVVLEYNTLNGLASNSSRRNSQLLNAFWRYQSSNYQIDGTPMWGLELGYGLSNIRSGPYLSVATSVIPGLLLQAKYQGASSFTDVGQFSLSLVSSMGTQSGFYAGNRRLDEMRTQGGLMVQPFIDRNANGKRDSNEAIYTESTDYLKINYDFLPAHRMEEHRDRVLVRLVPGKYRVDLDPAGFPMEFQPVNTTLAVNVREGSYTPVMIPLQPVYTISGVITKPDGQPANGVRIEAINQESQESQFTLTNGAGVYYLETLQRGQYEIRINGKPLANQVVQLTENSDPLQEMNFTMNEVTSQR